MRTLGCLVKGCLSGIGVLLLAIVLLLCWEIVEGAMGAHLVAPQELGLTGQLAFGANLLFTPIIGLMDADGTDVITLTITDTNGLSWSPDGTKLAFIRGSFRTANLDVIGDDGTAHTRLITKSSLISVARWSPDGTEIAFAAENAAQKSDLYRIRADGSGLQRLTDDPADNHSPTWSPDGSYLAFISTRSGQAQLYTIRSNGTELTHLTQIAGDVYAPDWSPTGKVIAFWMDHNIYTIAPDGSQITQLTHTRRDYTPVWSPNGSQIAFERDPWFSDDPDFPDTSLYRMNADGSGVTKLTSNEVVVDTEPTWSPDGSALAFCGAPGYRTNYPEYGIYVVRADGAAMARVRKTGESYSLAWRPSTPTPAR